MAIDVGIKGSIITGGLGRPACEGMIINMPFQLACFQFIPPIPLPAIPPPPPGKGGSIPLAPGEIQDFYTPVDFNGEGDLAKPSVYGKRMITIKMLSKFFDVEKEFMISERKVKYVIKAANVVNNTMVNMKVVATNIKNLASRGITAIKRFSWRVKP